MIAVALNMVGVQGGREGRGGGGLYIKAVELDLLRVVYDGWG